MGLRERRERDTAAWVSKRNGCWFIQVTGEQAMDASPEELFDCASSLAAAKRIARKMAAEFGFAGAARWDEEQPGRLWVLEMTEVGEEYDGEDD